MNTKCGNNARKREMSIPGKERDKKIRKISNPQKEVKRSHNSE
jgi:hypothetical protein